MGGTARASKHTHSLLTPVDVVVAFAPQVLKFPVPANSGPATLTAAILELTLVTAPATTMLMSVFGSVRLLPPPLLAHPSINKSHAFHRNPRELRLMPPAAAWPQACGAAWSESSVTWATAGAFAVNTSVPLNAPISTLQQNFIRMDSNTVLAGHITVPAGARLFRASQHRLDRSAPRRRLYPNR